MNRVTAVLVFLLSLAMAGSAQRRTYNQGAGGPIPAGTQVQVRFIDNLNSATAKPGDVFRGTLEQPIVLNGRTLYAKGANVTGQVVASHASGRLADPGVLELALTSIGNSPVNFEPLKIKGESHTKSNVTKIGGGAAAGAIIGAIAGGGKGAAIGAGVGAAAGTGVAAATGKKEAKIESEAVLNWVAAQPASSYASPGPAWSSGVSPAAQRDVRSFDDPRNAAGVPAQFDGRQRQSIRSCFSNTSGLPPGLAKRDHLPPGLERQVQRNGTLPPGLQKRVQPLPQNCSIHLPRLPVDWSRVVLGRRVLLLDPGQKIVDLFSLDAND